MKTKHLLFILSFFFYSFVFSQEAMKKETTSKKLAVLAPKSINAFKIKSQNKVEEFYSYLNILGNPEMNIELKKHTILEVKKLFKDSKITIPDFLNDVKKEIQMEEFLLKLEISKIKIQFLPQDIGNSVVQNYGENQSWTVGYILNLTIGSEKKSFRNVMQNVSLLNEEKSFGKKSKTVWNTYFTSFWMK
jgi:hypothetical protein